LQTGTQVLRVFIAREVCESLTTIRLANSLKGKVLIRGTLERFCLQNMYLDTFIISFASWSSRCRLHGSIRGNCAHRQPVSQFRCTLTLHLSFPGRVLKKHNLGSLLQSGFVQSFRDL
jgi:hypothetical protein